MELVFLGLAIGAALVFLVQYCHRTSSWTKSLVKSMAVGALAVCSACGAAPIALTVGLLLGAIGDFFLSRDGDRAFVAGLVAFALGHLAYVVLIWQMGGRIDVNVQTFGFLAVAVGLAAVLVPRAGTLAVPVLVYVLIIGAMGVLALGLPPNWILGTVAALLFATSDAVLGLSLFVLAPKWKTNWPVSAVIWVTYFGAQLVFLLAFGGVLAS